MTTTRTVPRILVQTANQLASSNSGWTTQDWLTCREFSYGAGQVVGYALLEQKYGKIKRPGRLNVEQVGPAPNLDWATPGTLSGKLVRLCIEDAAGTITDEVPYYIGLPGVSGGNLTFETVTYTAVWWGVIRGPERGVDGADDSPGGVATWRAAGLADILDRCIIDTGHALNAAGSSIRDFAICPKFNDKDYGNGNRSTATGTINNATVYYFDMRTNSGVGDKWTAKQVLDFVIAAHAKRTVSPVGVTGLAWTVSDALSLLSYEVPELDLNGKSVLEALNMLAGPQRGLSWYLSISGSTPTINIVSGSASAITVGSYTLAASTSTATLDITDSEFLQDVRILEDDSEASDIIIVQGDRPWTGITLAYQTGATLSLAKGWTGAQETAWDTDPEASGLDMVWRRFIIEQSWNGQQYTQGGIYVASGLSNTLSTTTSADYGVSGYDGARSFSGSTSSPASYQVKAERNLPGAQGAGSNRLDPKDRPRVIVSSNGGSSWTDLTEDFSVSIESCPLAVVIDDGDNGATLKSLLADSGDTFVISVGVREVYPLQVSWVRDPAQWPNVSPRVRVLEDRGTLHRTLIGTVTGVTGGGLEEDANGTTYRDDTNSLRGRLALARSAYGESRYRISWTDRMRALTASTGAAYQPGFLLTTVTTGTETISCKALIQRRTCRFVNNHWNTEIEAETLRMSADAVL